MIHNKRGDTYSALIILIIGVSIVLYILMLPPEERAKLLEENLTSEEYADHINVETLLDQQPGVLDFLAKDVVELEIPSINIYTKRSGDVLAQFDSIYLKKSLFTEEKKNITFKIQDLDLVDNVLLSFSSKNHTGRLTVTLNGETLMNKELDSDSPAPLQLQKSLLKEDNVVEFEVSGPGIEFWKANEYVINNVKVTADVTDVSGQENKQYFTLTNQQKKLLEYGGFSTVIDCAKAESIPLEIYLNKKLIYSGIPDCGAKTEIKNIDKDKIIEGENLLWFRSIGGNYLLYSTKVSLKLTQPVYPTYYFDITEDQLDLIDNETADVELTMNFPNAVDYKQGVIYVNDGTLEIETRSSTYSKNINKYMREGTNSIQIRPKRDRLEISQIKVVYGET